MRKTKVILPTVVAVVIVGGITVSGHAGKPEGSPSLPKNLLVSVTGGIQGEGDAAHMQVTFIDSCFGDPARTYVANPDGPLEVLGVRKGPRTLRYYYCDACSPDGVDCCNDPCARSLPLLCADDLWRHAGRPREQHPNCLPSWRRMGDTKQGAIW